MIEFTPWEKKVLRETAKIVSDKARNSGATYQEFIGANLRDFVAVELARTGIVKEAVWMAWESTGKPLALATRDVMRDSMSEAVEDAQKAYDLAYKRASQAKRHARGARELLAKLAGARSLRFEREEPIALPREAA